MNFTTDREKLLGPLQLACGVVERKQTAPILSNLLLDVRENSLTIVGCDEEVEISLVISDIDVESGGAITVPARKLMDICRSLTDSAPLTAKRDGNRVQIDSGRFTSSLASLPPDQFPSIEPAKATFSVEMLTKQLRWLLKRTSFAMGQQDVRYFFNGTLFEISAGRVHVVATNGQRLATCYLEVGDHTDHDQFIVPRKAIAEIARLIASLDDEVTVRLDFTSNHMTVDVPGARLVTKLIDATYPDYSRAIPLDGDKVMLVDRQTLKDALSRTAILSNELYRNVRLILLQDRLDMHTNNPQQEEAEETLIVSYSGESVEIGFNVSYLIEALSAMAGSQVRMTFSDSSSACLLEDVDEKECLYVISPMML